MIGAILGRRFFTLSTEELILELVVLPAKLFDLGFEVLGPMHGPSVHGLPISHLLPQFGILAPQFGILAPQFGDFLAKPKDFALKLPHQFGQIGWLERQEWVDKRVFHDREACNPDLPSMKSPSVSTKNGMGEALPSLILRSRCKTTRISSRESQNTFSRRSTGLMACPGVPSSPNSRNWLSRSGKLSLEGMINQALANQAQAVPQAAETCGVCGEAVQSGPPPEPRAVTTMVGQARWQEPKRYCPKCRAAFFPSVPEFGD